MEVADFVHLDLAGKRPVLTLLHVKGAASTSSGRRLSVASYEVVTSQAVKNLRHLESELLREALTRGRKREASAHVWYDGRAADRDGFTRALRGLGRGYERRVVVLQPHCSPGKVRSGPLRCGQRGPENSPAARRASSQCRRQAAAYASGA
ncbi:hypothetical protein FAIPA1_70139 [Frankia sp. AiPs1]